MTYARSFLNREHNRMEAPMDDCLRCHAMFFEGTARDLVRLVQQARRDADLVITDRIELALAVPGDVAAVLDAWGDELRRQTLATSLAVIAPDGSARRRVAMRAYESLAIVAGRSIGVDIVVLTPSMLGSERDLAGSVVRAVSRDGVVVYESSEVTS